MKGKKITFNLEFLTNLDDLTKRMQASFNNLKINFKGSDTKTTGYFAELEKQLTSYKTAYTQVMKDLSKPGLSADSGTRIFQALRTQAEATTKSITAFRTSLSNTFGSKANQDNIASIQNLRKELEKLDRAQKSLTNAQGQRKDILDKAKELSGDKTINANKIADIATRANRINNMQLAGDKLTKNDEKFLKKYDNIINQLLEYYDEIKKIDASIDHILSRNGLEKGTQTEFATRKAEINADMKSILSETLMPDDYEELLLNTSAYWTDVKQNLSSVEQHSDNITNEFKEQAAALEREKQAAASIRSILAEIGIYISAAGLARYVKELVKDSYEFYKSLDDALTQIVVVSDLSRESVQKLKNDFIEMSRQTGMAIDDIAEAAVLYFQQGLSTDEVLVMTEVTAQFAKVAGIDAAKAADNLTAAINGYRLSAEDAASVADKFNKVAADTAADIEELSTAFSKAASQANQAGVSMDNYLAYIAVMEEVTREAPENIGTSLKTIFARMQQVKEVGQSLEDGEVTLNNVQTALRSVGVELTDETGQLRDLQDVLGELGPKWNSLDRNTQAYIGTIVAGTRQQSRFVSLMQNWDRVLEVAEASEQSAGMQTLMHVKAMNSLEGATKRLSNAWEKFLSNLGNSDIFIKLFEGIANLLSQLGSGGALTAGLTALALAGNRIGQVFDTLRDKMKKWSIDNIKNFKDGGKAALEHLSTVRSLEKEYNELLKINKKAALGKKGSQLENMSITPDKVSHYANRFNLDNFMGGNPNLVDWESVEVTEALTKAVKEQFTALSDEAAAAVAAKIVLDQYSQTKSELIKKEKDAAKASTDAALALGKGLLGIITAIVSFSGGLDNVFGQLIIGLAAIGVALVAVVKATEEELTIASGGLIKIIEIISLALTGVFTFIKALINASKAADKALEEANESVADLDEQIQALKTSIDVLEDLAKTYEDLSSKIALTTTEQEKLNDTIRSMADAANIKTYEDTYGNLVINQAEWDKYLKSQQEELEKQRVKLREEAQKIGKAGLGNNKKQMVSHYQDNKSTYSLFIPELSSDMGTTRDNYNNIIASSDLKNRIQQSLIEAAQNIVLDSIKDYSRQELKNIDLAFETENAYAAITEGLNASNIEKTFIKTNDLIKKSANATYKEIFDDIETYVNGLELGEEQTNALIKAIQSAIYGDSTSNILGIRDIIKETKAQINYGLYGDDKEAQMDRINEIEQFFLRLNNEALKFVTTLDVFKDWNIAKDLGFTEEDAKKFSEAFSISTQQGLESVYTFLHDKLSDPDLPTELKNNIIDALKEVYNQLSYSGGYTWSQLAEEIDKVTQKVKTLNDIIESVAKNGGMTLDEFSQLGTILDNIDISKLGEADLNSYSRALREMNAGISVQNGLITMNQNALDKLKDIEMITAKVELETMRTKLQAKQAEYYMNMKYYEAQRDAVKAQLDLLTTEGEASISAAELKAVGDDAYIKNLDNVETAAGRIYSNMTEYVEEWAIDTISAVEEVGKAFNKFVMGEWMNDSGGFTRNLQQAKQTISNLMADAKQAFVGNDVLKEVFGEDYNFEDSLDPISADKIQLLKDRLLASYNSLNNTYNLAKTNYESVTAQIVTISNLIDNLQYLDLDSEDLADELDKYIGKLQEIDNLLRKISSNEGYVKFLESAMKNANGKSWIDYYNKELKTLEELTEQYKDVIALRSEMVLKEQELIKKSPVGDVFNFDENGTIQVNMKKYLQLQNQAANGEETLLELADNLWDEYNGLYDELISDSQKYVAAISKEIEIRQQQIDKYIELEKNAANAVKDIYQDMLDDKLEAIDTEIEALDRLKEAYEEANEQAERSKELSNLQTSLKRAMMDTSGASNSKVLSYRDQIQAKLEEMGEDEYTKRLDDIKQALEDQKESLQNSFNEFFEDWERLYEIVDKYLMSDEDSLINLFKKTQGYLEASDAERRTKEEGWKNDIVQATANLQGEGGKTIEDVQNEINELETKVNNAGVAIEKAIQIGAENMVTSDYYSEELEKYTSSLAKAITSSISSAATQISSAVNNTYAKWDLENKKATEKLPTGQPGVYDVKPGDRCVYPIAEKNANFIPTLVNKLSVDGNKKWRNVGIQGGSDVKYWYNKEGTQYSPTESSSDPALVFTGKYNILDSGRILVETKQGINGLNWVDIEDLRRSDKDTDNFLQFLIKEMEKALTNSGTTLTAEDYFRTKMNGFATGGLAAFTGPAWLDGTKSAPEAVLNAAETKAFMNMASALTKIDPVAASNGVVNIGDITFEVDSMSSPEDGEKAFDAFVNKFKEIGSQQGLNFRNAKI